MQTVNTTVLLKVAADWKDPCEAADQPLSDDVFSRIMLHHVRLIPGTEQNRTFTITGFWGKGYSVLECSPAVALSQRCTRLEHFKPIWWALAWIEDTVEASKDNFPFCCLLYIKKVDAGTCAVRILLCNVWGRHPLQRSLHDCHW